MHKYRSVLLAAVLATAACHLAAAGPPQKNDPKKDAKQPDPPAAKVLDKIPEPKKPPTLKPFPGKLPVQPGKAGGDSTDIKGRLPTETDAVAMALDFLGAAAKSEQGINPNWRFVWATDGEAESAQVVSLTTNYWSRGSVIVRPQVIAKEKLVLCLIDLSRYAGKNDLGELAEIWEEFRFDPRFNLLITRDTLRFASKVEVPKIKRVVQKLDKDGKVIGEQVTEAALGAGDVVRVPAPHLGDGIVLLSEVLGTEAPIITHSYFITRALTTIQDKGVFKTVYGGLYYQLAGIKRGNKKGTDEDNLFEALGVGNVERGITARKVFDDLRSDQRVAVFRSGITGQPRTSEVLRSLASRDSQGIIGVTHDLKKSSIDIGQHPVMNLLDFKDDAREVIFEMRTGLHGFALFNGEGALQDEVPPDIASDHLIPVPHGGRLQPAIGCIRCHGRDGGWKVLTNDVKRLLAGYLDVFGDDKSRRGVLDDLDRIAGLYAGDLELKLLPRARDDYANAVLKATGMWRDSKDQTDIVRLSSDKLASVFGRYNYDLVDTRQLLRDMGIEVAGQEEALALLRKLVPLPPQGVDGFNAEDARIGAMLVGLPIGRPDYDLMFSHLAARVYAGEGKGDRP